MQIWQVLASLVSGYVSGEDGGDGAMPGSTVSVSLVGLAVYLSWGLLFLSLIAILFFLACTPCQSIWCCGCSKPRKVPHMALDLVDIQYNLRSPITRLCKDEVEPPPPSWGSV